MKLRKVLAGLVAAVMAASVMAVYASAVDKCPDGYALIGFGDADWKISMWGKGDDAVDYNLYQTPVQITGDGTYTITVDLSGGYTNDGWVDEETGDYIELTTANGIGAMGINIWGAPDDAAFDIISVSFDGVDYPLQGASYSNNEDDGRRTNVYNAWASFDSSKEDHISKDPDNATATPINIDSLTEWSVCTVTFEAYNMGEAAVEAVDVDVDEAIAPISETADETTTATTEATATTANAAAAGNTSAAAATSKGSADTGIEGVAVVAGLAAAAAGAVIISKKRK